MVLPPLPNAIGVDLTAGLNTIRCGSQARSKILPKGATNSVEPDPKHFKKELGLPTHLDSLMLGMANNET